MPHAKSDDAVKKVAVILGASEFPRSANLKGNASFGRSAAAFRDYAMSDEGLAISPESVLDLFDSEERLDEQDQRIVDFLQSQAGASDLLIFYVGHAGFLFDREYFLALRSTIRGREPTTGFRIKALAHAIDLHFANKRVYLILDCCFAGEAVDDFQLGGSSAVSKLIEAQSKAALRASGTALLVASSKDEPAVAPSGAQYTMFSECFLEVLRQGIAGAGAFLTLTDVGDAVETRLRERFGQKAVRPEVHSPRQRGADIAKRIPLFPNHAFVAPEPARLPAYIASALESHFLEARRDAVTELGKCLRSDTAELAELARKRLQDLAQNDDSLSIRSLAAKTLDGTAPPPVTPGPAAAPEASATYSPERTAPAMDAPTESGGVPHVTPSQDVGSQEESTPARRSSKPQRRPATYKAIRYVPVHQEPRWHPGMATGRAIVIGAAGGMLVVGMSQMGWLAVDVRILSAYCADAVLIYLVVHLLRGWPRVVVWPIAAATGALVIAMVREVARWSYSLESIVENLLSPVRWLYGLEYLFFRPHLWFFAALIVGLSILIDRSSATPR